MFTTIQSNESNTGDAIKKSCEILRRGGLVVCPSDTVYGLLVDATNESAVKKLIQFKNRPIGKAISVFVADFKRLESVVDIPNDKKVLLNHLLPGPFTVILKSKHAVSKLLESEKGTLGVRIPNYSLVQELVSAYGKPVTATSANLGGRSAHYSIDSFLNEIPKNKKALIDLIVDAAKLPKNKPSTVVDLSTPQIKLIRRGDIVMEKSNSYISESPTQTRKIGRYLIEKSLKSNHKRPIVFILQGDLGSGKTEMVKGIASYFGIEKVISPTFVVYYEYDIKEITNYELLITNYSKFVHVDLFNIEDPEEFAYLGLEEYLKPGVVMCIEWGEKVGELYKKFNKKANVIFVEIKYKSENEREIKI